MGKEQHRQWKKNIDNVAMLGLTVIAIQAIPCGCCSYMGEGICNFMKNYTHCIVLSCSQTSNLSRNFTSGVNVQEVS